MSMREIIFRGKRIDNGEWVEGWLNYSEQQDRYYIGVTEIMHPVDPETVGQFTGLKDKNGNKIFEGDIVKIQDEDVKIFFNQSMASWDYEYEGGDCEPIIPDGSYYDSSGFEVIGNIHEN